ncbi:MAG: glycosyltransferase 87 family protein [Chloroflexota bacterium]
MAALHGHVRCSPESLVWKCTRCQTYLGAGGSRTEGRRVGLWLAVLTLALVLVALKPIRGALSFSKQADPLILLLLVGTLAAFVRRRDGWAAVVLALAVAVKPFLAILGLWLLWKRAYRAVLLAGGLSAVLVLGPLVALGRLGEYVEVAAYWSGPAMVASPVSQSLASLLDRTLIAQPYTAPLVVAPWLVAPLWLGVGLCLLGLLAVTVQRSRSGPPLDHTLEFGLVVAAMLVFGPLTEEHHLAYLVPGLAATLAAGVVGWRGSRAARWIAVLTAALVAVMMLPGTQDVAWGFYRYQERPISPPLSLVTGFWLYVIVAALVLNVAALRLRRQNVGSRT